MEDFHILKDIGRSITGAPNRACIVINDFRTQDLDTISPAGAVANAADVISKGASPGLANPGPAKKKFNVQFNPSELSIYSHSEPIVLKNTETMGNNQVEEQITEQPSMTLSVKLIFDDVEIRDAFMFEKAASTATGLVGGVIEAGRVLGGKVWSVRTPMNGLIGAILNKDTRTVTFNWGTFSFSGTIESVSGAYTMFSVSGEPIRGTVNLQIKKIFEENDTAWANNAFDKMFKNGAVISDLSRVSDKIGNIINL